MKKQILSFLISAAMSSSMICIPAAHADASTVYHISNQYDMLMASKNPNADYILDNNINISYFDLIGSIEHPFTGTFDGNGYTISTCTAPFGYIGEGGTVKNLAVNGIQGSYISEDTAGMIAVVNSGTISECFTYGKVDKLSKISGIAGINSGTIVNCGSTAEADASIAYTNDHGTIKNCYSPSSDTYLIDTNESGTVTGCFASSTNGTGINKGSDSVTLLNDSQMKQSDSFANWDFSSVWTTCDNTTSPTLKKLLGSGTIDNPYRVWDASVLSALGCGEQGKGKYFTLTDDISVGTPIGTEEEPFTGTLDGNGCTVTGTLFNVVGTEGVVHNVSSKVTINRGEIMGGTANKNYGTIRNCYVYIETRSSCGKDIGGIAGENVYGTIENCLVIGQISSNGTGVGGIVGYNNRGVIRGCASKLTTIYSSDHGVGGIAGDNSSGIIENCYSTSRVSSDSSEVGGISGRLYNGTIKNCYSISSVHGTDNVGGIVGYLVESGDVSGCYFNAATFESLNDKTRAGIGSDSRELYYAELSQLKNKNTFEGWDFNNTWFMDGGYPQLIAVSGNGTKENPYIIRTAADWKTNAANSLKSTGNRLSYKLAGDLSGTITPVGDEEDPFIGSVDGQNHKTNGTLINVLGSEGYITNICNSSHVNPLVTLNMGTIEYCTGNTSMAETNDGGKIKNSVVNASKFVLRNRNGGEITGCAAITTDSTLSFAEVNNNAKIENCYAYSSDEAVFVQKNDNGGKIINSVLNASNNSYFVEENYADISGCGVIFDNSPSDNASQTLFAIKNEGNITACKIAGADTESENVSFISDGDGDVTAVKNMEIPMCFTSGTASDIGSIYRTEPQNTIMFSDISDHWAEATILALSSKGIINGYEDGTFKPDNSVTKAEFLKLMLEAAGTSLDNTASPYQDANQSWAAKYVNTAFKKGLTENINASDTEFGVNDPITRLQAAAMTGRLLNPNGGTAEFTDSSEIPEWAAGAIGATVELGIITGMPDGSFAPAESLTRAQAAVIVSRIRDRK